MGRVSRRTKTKAPRLRRGQPDSDVAKQRGALQQELARHPAEFTSRVGPGGRVQIPATLRRLLGLQVGQEVLLVPDADGRLVVTNRDAALRYARQLVKRHVPTQRSLAAELLAERRTEAMAEASRRG